MEHGNYAIAASVHEYLLLAAIEYWTAMAFPAIYLAKYL